MKKSLKFFTASMIAVSTTTLTHSQSFFNQEDARAYRANINARIEELNEKAKTDDNALKDLLRLGFNLSISNGGSFIENMRKSKEIEKELVKTDEDKKNIDRQIKVVEMMVQEGISDFMKNEKNDFSGMDITIGIIMLGVDSNYDIIPLLKECFQIKNDLLSHNALANYIKIKGAEALPFLHELLEAANLSNESRATIFKELERTAQQLKQRKQAEDAEKINTFLNELKQAKQEKATQNQLKPNDNEKPVSNPEPNIQITTEPISQPPTPEPTPPIITNKTTQPIPEISSQQPKKTSINPNLLWFVAITFFAVIGGAVAWKKTIKTVRHE